MSIKDWPNWKKTLGIISLVTIILDIIALFIVWLPCFTRQCDIIGEAMITAIILLPILGIIIGLWLIGFLIGYLRKNNMLWVVNVISIIGLAISGVIILLTLLEYTGIRGFDFRGWFPIPFSLIIFVFFLIVTIFINLKRKG